MKYVSLIILLALVGCGGGGTDATTSNLSNGKSLFSSWAEDGGTFVLDLSALNFGTNFGSFTINAGGTCDCMLAIGGTQESGNISFSLCTYNPRGAGGADPGCTLLNGGMNYYKSESTLTLSYGSRRITFH